MLEIGWIVDERPMELQDPISKDDYVLPSIKKEQFAGSICFRLGWHEMMMEAILLGVG